MSAVTPEPANVVRFPRASAMLDMAATAAVLRAAADELDELAGTAHSYEPGTLRRMAWCSARWPLRRGLRATAVRARLRQGLALGWPRRTLG